MTAEQYVAQVLAKYHREQLWTALMYQSVFTPLSATLSRIPGVVAVLPSGSYAKGTAVVGSSDIDLFLSFQSGATALRDIYQEVFDIALRNGWSPRKQNVSIGITYESYKADLVPGKQHSDLFSLGDHSLYRSKVPTWTKTNIEKQIAFVRNSRCTSEIKALKIWRNAHRLEFPSFCLELAVIEALRSDVHIGVAARVMAALRFMAERLPALRLIDPANTSNVVSDDMTIGEKNAVAHQASASVKEPYWEQIIA